MALMPKNQEPRESNVEVDSRFGIAQDGQPTEEQLTIQSAVRVMIVSTAERINTHVADSREKSLALTHLEEALMWAGKAIFR
jgi:hypothetical protein